MKPSPASRSALACALAFAAGAAALHAQVAASGTVTGRLTDASTQLSLGGARVAVEGTAIETYSASNGNFVLSHVPAGEQTLVISYVGYPEVRQTVTVASGETARADVDFGSETIQLDALVIEGTAVGTARAINQQRASATYTNIVAADDIGRFPDQNAAESLSRLPGVSVYRDQGEGRFVNVRGINYTLGNVTLDGSGLASPESGQRAIALDVVPSDSLGALEVAKVPTPDQTHEGLGGNVNLRSKSPFDNDEMAAKLSAQSIYSKLSEDFGYKFNGEVSTISEDGKLGIIVGFSQQERTFGSYNVETDRWTPQAGGLFAPTELQFRDYTVERERTGLNSTVEYRPNENVRLWVRGTYNDFTDSEDRQTLFLPVSDDNVNSITPIDNSSGIVDDARRISRRARDRVKEQQLLAFTTGGEVKAGNLVLDGQLGYSRGEEDKYETQARFRRSVRDTNFQYDINDYAVRITQLGGAAFEDPASYNQFQRFDVESDQATETELNAMLNAKYELNTTNPAYVKVGAGLRNKEKDRDEAIYEYEDSPAPLAFTDYVASASSYPYGPRVPRIRTGDIVRYFNQNRALFSEEVADILGNDYTVNEDVYITYGMAGMTFGRLNVIAGLRIEYTDTSTTGNEVDGDGEFLARGSDGNSYTDVLPGLHFRYDATDRLVLRASYSHSIVRPAFGESAFGRSIDSDDLEITERNPGLEALNSRNLDASVEYYLPLLGLFSAAVFHKDIKDFTYLTDVGTRVIGTDTYAVERFENGNEGYIYGLELSHTQQLRFLPGPLANLSIQSNLTLSDSEAEYGDAGKFEFIGQSDVLGNVSLTYEDKRFLARISANFRSDRLREDEDISNGGTQIYIDDSLQFDLTLAYKINRNFEVFAEVVNLTNEAFRVYSKGGPNNQPALFQQFEEYDYSVYAGLRWKL